MTANKACDHYYYIDVLKNITAIVSQSIAPLKKSPKPLYLRFTR